MGVRGNEEGKIRFSYPPSAQAQWQASSVQEARDNNFFVDTYGWTEVVCPPNKNTYHGKGAGSISWLFGVEEMRK